MPIDIKRARTLLKELDLKRLFVEELNWQNPQRPAVSITCGEQRYRLTPQAEAGGLVLFTVDKCPGDGLPDRPTRLAIHRQLLDRAQEHILVFINQPRTTTLWMWVDREGAKRKGVHEHRFHVSQQGDSLLQKLEGLAFNWNELDDEGKASIFQVTDRLRANLATERVTKRFYDEFQKQHKGFLSFIEGIDATRDREWYASIMLNRLMFIYFIQKKGFLGGDTAYLRTRLADCQMQGIPYYDGFLKPLFFKGFACKPEERTSDERALLGDIPYLNGGLFLKHQIEEANGGIDIPDEAFETIFAFFDRYQWHLDDRPLRADNEINPDVLGYIFEKYINQKQMGAYYTKEDITEYITKNTVLPFLFDRLMKLRPGALEGMLPHPQTPCPSLASEPSMRRGGLEGQHTASVTEHERGCVGPGTTPSAALHPGTMSADETASDDEVHRVMGAARRDKVTFAREQRREPTRAEKTLWGALRGQALGAKFRRQHPIGDFVLDFYCESARLAVELDGPSHEESAAYDAWRDEQLAHLDIRTLRIPEDQVFTSLKDVLTRITAALAPPTDAPHDAQPSAVDSPLRPGEGAGGEAAANPQPPSPPSAVHSPLPPSRRTVWGEGAGGEAATDPHPSHSSTNNPHQSSTPSVVLPLSVPERGSGGEAEPYIYDALKKGVTLPLPPNIAAGLDDVSQRGDWNKRADEDYALPTETWREHIARRRRYQQILNDFAAGKITTINDFITYNLDIIKFTHDFLSDTQDPMVIKTFYFDCLQTVSILDPTCGSGAFLFAALSILEPIYELCLQRMEEFMARKQRMAIWDEPFKEELLRLKHHASRRYFIYKSIIVDNLYGVDIMEEAVEICKLRLFLKLVAQVEDVEQVEPLPDIDFNIRAGNTLVGYSSLEAVESQKAGTLDFGGVTDRVREVARKIADFRALQTHAPAGAPHLREAKANLLTDLNKLEAELNSDLAFEYGVTKAEHLQGFVDSHKPFHWCIGFYDIMARGGFDVIIGNPPYVEVPKNDIGYQVRGFATADCPDVYAMVVERATALLASAARLGMIVPISIVCADKFAPLQGVLASRSVWLSNYSNRPAQLFEGAQKRLTIAIAAPASGGRPETRTTEFRRWFPEERDTLLLSLVYGSQQGLPTVFEHSMAKVGLTEGLSVAKKAFRSERRLRDATVDHSPHRVYYVRTPGYFCQFWARAPMVRELKTGKTRPRGELYSDDYADSLTQMAVLAALNSSLFFYYWSAHSDCRHMNRRDVADFPFDPAGFSQPELVRLGALASELMADYENHLSWMKKSGLEIESFAAAESKHIIDRIDRVLAEHYGFTDEELDFIINYDIKYRMGSDEGDG